MRFGSQLFLVTAFVAVSCADAFGVKEPISTLLQTYASDISTLKAETEAMVGTLDKAPYNNDVFYLRYCLGGKGVEELKGNLEWRLGDGKGICEAAAAAYDQATSGDGRWNNEPVRDSAPFAGTINKYITPENCLTTASSKGDLVYCVQSGKIDDVSLMSTISVDNMVDFFLYGKEINAIFANDQSMALDKVVSVINIVDLNGLKLIGGKGDANFRKALSASSKKASELYPGLAGPQLLLNLPRLLTASVKLFKPLFPPDVSARLKFENGPLKKVDRLLDVSYGGKDRDSFLEDLERLCY